MEQFNVIWKFSVIGLLLAIVLSLGMIKFKIDDIERLLTIPDVEMPLPEEPQDGQLQ
jgi:hypothetical protein